MKKQKQEEIRALIKAGNEIPHAGGAALVLLVPDINETVRHNGKEVHIKDVKAWLLGIE